MIPNIRFYSPTCGPNTYQKMYEETLDFNVSISNGNIMPDRKINFAVNSSLKLFRATVAVADIGSLKSLHTFLEKCLYHMPV